MTTPTPPKRAAAGTHHVVAKGDTAWAIAQLHGVSLTQLAEVNPKVNLDRIRAGQKLVIPGEAPAEVDTPVTPEAFRVLPPPPTVTNARFNARTGTKGITVHCSATRPSQNFGASDIDRMHRNIGWLAIGYHFIIRRDGTVEAGRPIHAMGSHCRDGDRNRTHIGVCLVGGVSEKPQKHIPGNPWNGSDAECNFTEAQMEALRNTIAYINQHYGRELPVEGHRDVPGVRKACPSFKIGTWLASGAMVL